MRDFAGTERFVVERCIGSGGMGVVYEAHDVERNTRVALKTLRAADPQALYRLKKEFRALQDIQHPNLVSLGELIEEEGNWFYTMDLIAGVDFLSHVRPRVGKSRAELDVERLRSALGQLASGLLALHDAGKVHRDIKPSNILVSPEGRVVVLDFGLVAETGGTLQTTAGETMVTAAYMAPEQAAGKRVGPEADWYATGILLHQALTGELPFRGAPLEVLMDKQRITPPPPSALVSDLPRDLDALCTDLLAFDPAGRPTAPEILARLGFEEEARAILAARVSPLTGSAPFVGRERELKLLLDAFADTRAGSAATVFLHGASGVGKSALVRRFRDEVRRSTRDLVVLAGRCYERESVPYKAFDGVMDALSVYLRRIDRLEASQLLPRHASELPRVFPVLARVEAVVQAPRAQPVVRDPHELRKRVFGAIRELLTRLADTRPLIVVIDDLQWAGQDSQILFSDLLRPPDAPPMLLIASSRSAELPGIEASAAPALRETRLGKVLDIPIGPLPDEDARTLARSLLRREEAEDAVSPATIAAEAEGHPLYIQELVRHAVTTDSGGERPRLDEAIWERVTGLDATARHILELICVVGQPIPQQVVSDAAEIEAAELERSTSLLRAAYMIRSSGIRAADYLEPYHDRVRETVVDRLGDAERIQRHKRLAAALESAEFARDRPELILRQLEAAGEDERASEYATRAGDGAAAALAFDRAAECYLAALRLGTADEDRARALRLDLADALANAGRGPEAADMFGAAAEGATAAVRLECHQRAADQLLASGHIERGLDAIGNVLAQIGTELPGTPRRALMSMLWQRMKLRLRGRRWKARDETEIARSELIRLDAYKAVALGLSMVDTIRAHDFQARGLLLALRTGERRRVARSLAFEAIAQSITGQRGQKRAAVLLDDAGAIAEESGDPYLVGWLLGARGSVDYLGGRFRVGCEELAAAEVQFRDHTTGSAWELDNVRIFRLFALRRLGRYRELRRAFTEYREDANRRGDRYAVTTLTRSCSFVWLTRDEPEAAEADLARDQWTPPEQGYHMQHWYELRALAELSLYRGTVAAVETDLVDGFERLQRSLLTRAQVLRAEAAWLRGRTALALAAGRGEAKVPVADKCAKQLDAEGTEYAAVWGQFLRAGVATRAGDRARARGHLSRAVEIAEANEMRGCRAAARWRLSELTDGVGGESLRDRAQTEMEEVGIVQPERLTEVFIPGFS